MAPGRDFHAPRLLQRPMSSASTHQSRSRRLALAATLFAALIAVLLLAGGSSAGAAAPVAKFGELAKPGKPGKPDKPDKPDKPTKMKQPNIVLVMTDDQAPATLIPEAMPNLFGRMIPRSTSFTDYIVTTPLCCPLARPLHDRSVRPQQRRPAELLRRPQAEAERAPGLAAVRRLQHRPRRQVPQRLRGERRRAGSRRAGLGSLVHGAREAPLLQLEGVEERQGPPLRIDDDDHVDQGDQRLRDALDQAPGEEEGSLLHAGRLLRAHTSTGPRHALRLGPRPRADRRAPLRHLSAADPGELQRGGRLRQAQERSGSRPPRRRHDRQRSSAATAARWSRSTASIAGSAGSIRGSSAQGELNQTVFIFTSDNGFFYGEHRIAKGKPDPYEENIHMPLTISVPPKYRDRAELVPDERRADRQHRPRADDARARRRRALPEQERSAGRWTAAR